MSRVYEAILWKPAHINDALMDFWTGKEGN